MLSFFAQFFNRRSSFEKHPAPQTLSPGEVEGAPTRGIGQGESLRRSGDPGQWSYGKAEMFSNGGYVQGTVGLPAKPKEVSIFLQIPSALKRLTFYVTRSPDAVAGSLLPRRCRVAGSFVLL
jgi:hypothetical protein